MMMRVYFIFAACAVVYLGFTAVLIIRGGRKRADVLLLVAVALTALKAAAMAFWWSSPLGGQFALADAVRPLEVVVSVAWILFVLELTVPRHAAVGRVSRSTAMFSGAVIAAALLSFLEIKAQASAADAQSMWASLLFAGRICLALIGLAAIENLMRNVAEEAFWSVKYLGIGIGGIFAYDFFVHADGLLFRTLRPELIELRAAVLLVVLPLIFVGARRALLPDRPIGLSHRMAFHSAAILGGGIYLLVMGAAGYYIRQVGGSFSSLFTGLFLVGALLLLVVILASGSFRAWLKVWLYKNLFLYKYDYRQEWLRFINTVATDQSGSNLRLRVIKSIANIVDSTGGALWEWQDADQRYDLTETWNYNSQPQGRTLDNQLVGFFARKGWIVDLEQWRAQPDSYDQMTVPDWLRDDADAWILVPLLHRSHVLGVVLLKRSRAVRLLNWEDFDLLKMCGRQVASYLSESAAVQALSAARELEIFNRRFAFVIHDIKNTISQLSLMLKNAEKHGENPAFQKDLLASVGDSVAAMSRILDQINAERRRTPAVTVVDLAGLVERIAGQRAKGGGTVIRIECESKPLNVLGDEYRLTAILSHLIQNAADAAGERGEVNLTVHRADGMVALNVTDNGSGMDPQFVRDQLFQPFQSTKTSGFGIGAYQCRELIRELGGRLTVHSVPAEGTTMSVVLPAAAASVEKTVRVV